MRKLERRANLIVSLGRAESHHDIFKVKNRFEPRPEQDGNIQRRQGTLSNDNGMNKFYGNVLSVGGVGTASECE